MKSYRVVKYHKPSFFTMYYIQKRYFLFWFSLDNLGRSPLFSPFYTGVFYYSEESEAKSAIGTFKREDVKSNKKVIHKE